MTIKIRRHYLNEGLDKYVDKNCLKEFELLNQLIENDDLHQYNLNAPNNLLRYSDIRPYSYNNVGINYGNEYINASWIHIPLPKTFIATQGPIPKTVEDFWAMCYQYDVEIIIMLCKVKEKNVEKCAKYWDAKNMYHFEVNMVKEEHFDKGLDLRVFQLFDIYQKNKIKKIIQIHLTSWEDHTALDVDYFDMIIKIIEFIDNNNKNNNPVVVHCSAGVGRTGTFISLYNLYHEIRMKINRQKDFIEFSVFNLVRKIKELRMYMVENVNQYILLYQFIDYLLYTYNK